MAVAALIAWIATAAGGFVLVVTWLTGGGPGQHRVGQSRFAPRLVLSHVGLAGFGLVVWIVAVATGKNGLRWISVAILPFVAALGVTMFLKWLGGRGAHGGTADADLPAEQQLPVAVVALHGILAGITVLLAVLAAAGLGS
jgi:hypothetical protein